MSELSGLRVVVTSGASGIGLATAQLLGSRGAAVAVLDLDPTGVPEPITGLRADVSQERFHVCGELGVVLEQEPVRRVGVDPGRHAR